MRGVGLSLNGVGAGRGLVSGSVSRTITGDNLIVSANDLTVSPPWSYTGVTAPAADEILETDTGSNANHYWNQTVTTDGLVHAYRCQVDLTPDLGRTKVELTMMNTSFSNRVSIDFDLSVPSILVTAPFGTWSVIDEQVYSNQDGSVHLQMDVQTDAVSEIIVRIDLEEPGTSFYVGDSTKGIHVANYALHVLST